MVREGRAGQGGGGAWGLPPPRLTTPPHPSSFCPATPSPSTPSPHPSATHHNLPPLPSHPTQDLAQQLQGTTIKEDEEEEGEEEWEEWDLCKSLFDNHVSK